MSLHRFALASIAAAAAIAACSSPPPPSPPPPAPSAAPAASSSVAAAEAPPACEPGTHLAEGRCEPDAPPPPPPPKPRPCAEGMALVPGGTYEYGAKKAKAEVAALCFDVTEVTAEQYGACVKSGKCTDKEAKCAAQATYGVAGKEKHPMVCVDFSQAVAYCDAQGKRLPTDEEWEWAARGGSEGRKFPWGNDAPRDQLCWSGNGALKGTCEVGAFAKGDNPQGIHDLAGGVFEFTTTKNDPKSPTRVGRGGSWKDGVEAAFKATRVGGFAKDYRCGFLGIRCVKAPTPVPSSD